MPQPANVKASFLHHRLKAGLLDLRVGLALFLLLASLALAGMFWKTRETQLNYAKTEGANLAWVLESRLSSTLRRVDGDLFSLGTELLDSGQANVLSNPVRAHINPRLALHARKFQEIRGIQYFDRQGQLLYSSDQIAPFSIAEHGYFRRLRDDPAAGLQFSEVLPATVDGNPIVVAARALRDKSGRFLGVLTIPIDLAHFNRLLESVDLGPKGVIAIRRSDDTRLVLRRPAMSEQINQPANYAIRDRIMAGEKFGHERLISPTDGIARLSSFRALNDYPFYIVLAASEADILAGWRTQTTIAASVAAFLFLLLSWLSLRMARSETNFRTLFDSIDDFLFVLDKNGKIQHINRSVTERLGYATKELIGQTLSRVYPTDVTQSVESELQRHGAAMPLCTRDGVLIPVETRLVAGRWNGSPARFGLSRDISERVRHQQALEAEITKRQMLLDRSRDGICILRMDGSITEFNPAFATMLGYPPEEMIQLHVWDWDIQWSRTELEQIIRDLSTEHRIFETRHKRKDGSVYDTEVSVNNVEWDGDGYLLCLHRDISVRKQGEAALRQSEERFRTLFEKNHSVMLLADPVTTQIVDANAAAIRFYGYTREQMIGMPVGQINMLPEKAIIENVKSVLFGDLDKYEVPHRLASGEIRTVEVYITPFTSAQRPLLFAIIHDVTERKLAEEQLRQAAAVFSHAREGIMITDANATIIDVNEMFTQITGYSREEILGSSANYLKSGHHDPAFYAGIWQALTEKGHWSGELWNRRKNGEEYPALQTISAVRDARGKTLQYVSLFSDITESKAHEHQLEYMAHYDALTGLPNRSLFADRLQQAMAQTLRRQQRLAVVYLDLDGFKLVNDSLGHAAGDQLLITIAARMKHALREGDTLARLSGDEFAAILLDLADTDSSEKILNRLLEVAAQPIDLDHHAVQVSASIGVAFYPQEQGIEPDQLLRQADQAMYKAKMAGKNHFCFFES